MSCVLGKIPGALGYTKKVQTYHPSFMNFSTSRLTGYKKLFPLWVDPQSVIMLIVNPVTEGPRLPGESLPT